MSAYRVKILIGTLSALLLPHLASAADASLLHPVFQDHVVLQRDAPIRLWGDAAPGTRVTVQLESVQVQARADRQGHWEARLPAHAAGGPYSLKASGADGVVQQIDDVLIGDVWLCSGQSNMELQVHRTLDSRSEIADADHPTIRMFKVPAQSSPTPQRGFGGAATWQRTTPETVKDFSAACYYFARELQKSVDVPMGLINASWGGSQLQAWIGDKALRAAGDNGPALDVLARYATDPVAAAPRWAALWETWWHAHGEGEPWQPDAPGDWQNAPPALGAWDDWGVPQLVGFNGMVWYRTSVELTQAQAAQDATLLLGPVDELDQTWVNGRGVGSSYGADQPRRYALPRGRLHAGRNSIVLNVLNTYRRGGLLGDAQSRALQFADGSTLALDAPWHYRIVSPTVGTPPRAPWSSAAGLTTLYNGMIAPLGQLGLRGALWYQGESNTGDAVHYPALLSAWQRDWRQRFGAELPLLVVQLANYGTPPTQPAESGWAQLREAQRRFVADDAHAGLAVAIDIGDRYDIHPANKQELGRRLARAARHVVYGEAMAASGPVPRSARRDGEDVRIGFDDVDTALLSYGNDAPIGFELCGGAAGSCRYTRATLSGREIRLRIPAGMQATRVRYCWADSPVCTLYDRSGLPAGPFELPITAAPSP
ncbi:sialate O-acetylesterase [Xanthomonas oryzae pv. oryzicola]|uniref:sialate O-acetylesterase n=1 Tax=Xanthomonas oryzae TaxID=347 RepID=UPI0003F7AAA9|nr:sialate O-acetylesterase [Xanthomonas oryzae]AJQ85903.1 9-O-acetylesterase [Xanthomonas oryzae pv. oryzicola]AKO06170.1 9-O-acetylesterase [Xanthomonas oryzae pv. oryzicola]AKO10083.1 9-O-acetylesterase [Xanthomonas oryzae pv. oryzicola]OWB29690.1 9-O-acetylesterase [Xanthomonas oryzae pv. oryzicola]OWB32895.1 9-O-acetylesterase [Xanthomonas oryzae pv. oryzicola]